MSQQELAARAGLRREKEPVASRPAGQILPSARRLAPKDFRKASFIDGSKAKILSWGKSPEVKLKPEDAALLIGQTRSDSAVLSVEMRGYPEPVLIDREGALPAEFHDKRWPQILGAIK